MKKLRMIGLLAVMLGLVAACGAGPSSVEWVDLGCSVLWASHNVGAAMPEEFGDYFAWGETEPKDYYGEENSLTYDKNGPWDNGISGNAQYDAATANWGKPCRMPTWEECIELLDKCDWDYEIQGRTQGFLVRGRGKYRRNTIFIPATGYRYHSEFNGIAGFSFWTGSTSNPGTAYSYGKDDLSSQSRCYGSPVRPVRDK